MSASVNGRNSSSWSVDLTPDQKRGSYQLAHSPGAGKSLTRMAAEARQHDRIEGIDGTVVSRSQICRNISIPQAHHVFLVCGSKPSSDNGRS